MLAAVKRVSVDVLDDALDEDAPASISTNMQWCLPSLRQHAGRLASSAALRAKSGEIAGRHQESKRDGEKVTHGLIGEERFFFDLTTRPDYLPWLASACLIWRSWLS